MNHAILKELNDQGYQIVFAPHPSIQEYMDEFTVPDFIKIYSYSEGNIQSVFQNTSVLITDYSSVAFDVAYLNKLFCIINLIMMKYSRVEITPIKKVILTITEMVLVQLLIMKQKFWQH